MRRQSSACLLQIWTADGFDHRLNAEKLASILKMAEPLLLDFQLPVEVKYGPEHVAQYVIRSVESNLTHVISVFGRKKITSPATSAVFRDAILRMAADKGFYFFALMLMMERFVVGLAFCQKVGQEVEDLFPIQRV